MDEIVLHVELLLLVAAAVAILTRRLRLPYTVGLVLAGGALALTKFDIGIEVSKPLIFNVLLPPLVFEAAFNLRWPELRREMAPLLALATGGVVLASAVVAGGLAALGWDWRAALLFGVLISATDPVSVIAAMRNSHSHPRLKLLIEAESLFNDGTAAALFSVVLLAMLGSAPSAAGIAGSVAVAVGGGLLAGAVAGFGCLALMGPNEDPLVEIAVSTASAFGSFLLAEHFGGSGVLATLVAGLMIGNIGPLKVEGCKGRDDAETFWEFAAFVANSFVFLLMGARLAVQHERIFSVAVGAAILLVLAGRALSVYGISALFSRSRHRISMTHQHVLVLGGLRGALALALALGLPSTMPGREVVVSATFGCVAFSVIVQGLLMVPVLARFGQPDQSSS